MAGRAALLLPKEHGTYGEVLFPLGTALLLGNATAAAWTIAATALGGYLAHEALAVWLGQRGSRARREEGPAALRSLALFGGVAAAGLVTSWALAEAELRLWLLVALGLAAAALALAWAGRERSTAGESLAGAALSAWGVPTAVAGGVRVEVACFVWAVWVVSFVASTLAVRGVIARNTRRNPLLLQAASGGLCAAAILCAWTLQVPGVAPAVAVAGLVPTIAAVLLLVVTPIPARRLRAVGWTLVTTSVLTMAVLVGAFRD